MDFSKFADFLLKILSAAFRPFTDYFQTFLPNASTYGNDIDALVMFITALVGIWFVLAEVVFFYFIIRFSRKRNPKAQYVTGEKEHEQKWIKIPHKLILVFDVFIILYAVIIWYNVKQNLPPAEAKVRIIAQQWAWTFVHPGADGILDTEDDIVTIDKLHVQNDTLYHFELQSKDVLHSFAIPVFRLVQDMIPGRTILGWFEATKTGEWDIQCREICGVGHGLMPARIVIHDKESYAEWVTAQKPYGPYSYTTLTASTNQ